MKLCSLNTSPAELYHLVAQKSCGLEILGECDSYIVNSCQRSQDVSFSRGETAQREHKVTGQSLRDQSRGARSEGRADPASSWEESRSCTEPPAGERVWLSKIRLRQLPQ